MTRPGESAPAPAIILAAFGTTDPEALGALLHIKSRVQAAFPDHETILTLTSRFIRRVWSERNSKLGYRLAYPEVPDEIFCPHEPISALAVLSLKGCRRVMIQSLHVADGSEYRDLADMVTQQSGLTPIDLAKPPTPSLALGPPALGDGSEKYLLRAAEALGELAVKARKRQAALVLMGHGNEHFQQAVYGDLEKVLRARYGPDIYLGLVEGGSGSMGVLANLRARMESRTVLLAPLMVVAGDHAKKDLAGDGPDSWASVLAAAGFRVELHLQGLGLNDSWADIYVEHLRELNWP